jgi:hypothetical protein
VQRSARGVALSRLGSDRSDRNADCGTEHNAKSDPQPNAVGQRSDYGANNYSKGDAAARDFLSLREFFSHNSFLFIDSIGIDSDFDDVPRKRDSGPGLRWLKHDAQL